MNATKPLFSIIIPTFNRAGYLQAAIDSVRKQTFTDWECIIIDDGSTDNSPSIVEQFEKADKRFKYFYQENKERSAARNNGISKSQGDYICFLDSDDSYDHNFLQELKLKIDETSADLLISSIEVNTPEISDFQEIQSKSLTLNDFFSSSIGAVRCCIRKSNLLNLKFDENVRISEDTLFLCDLVATQPTISIAPKAIYKSQMHDDNSVNFKRYNAYLERYKTLKLILTKPYASQLNTNIVGETLSNCFFGIFKFYYFNNRAGLARWTMFKALVRYPRKRTREKLILLLFAHRRNLFN